MLEESHFCFHTAADVLGLQDNVRAILLTPRRSAKGDIKCDPSVLSEGMEDNNDTRYIFTTERGEEFNLSCQFGLEPGFRFGC